jgi:hypothetical protein
MLGNRERWRLSLLVAAVAVLVGAGAGVGNAGEAEQFRGRSSAAVSANAAISAGAGGTLDTRVQRDINAGQRYRTPHHAGVGGPTSLGHSRRPWVQAQAGVLERAAHPERLVQILLRGPPGRSA